MGSAAGDGNVQRHRQAILLEKSIANWRWTKGYVENVAAAITLAVIDDRGAGRVYNVGEEPEQTSTMKDWVGEISKAANWEGEVVVVKDEEIRQEQAWEINGEQPMACSVSRLREELGFIAPFGLAECVSRTVAWERANLAQGQKEPLD